MDRKTLEPIILTLILLVFMFPLAIGLLASNMDDSNIIVKAAALILIPGACLIAIIIMIIPEIRKHN